MILNKFPLFHDSLLQSLIGRQSVQTLQNKKGCSGGAIGHLFNQSWTGKREVENDEHHLDIPSSNVLRPDNLRHGNCSSVTHPSQLLIVDSPIPASLDNSIDRRFFRPI